MAESSHQGSESLPSVSGGGGDSVPTTNEQLTQPTLDRYYGKGVEFTCRSELHRELHFLYRHWRWKKLLRLRRRNASHSDYVVVGNQDIQVLVDHKRLTIRAIEAIETRGPVGRRELDAVTIVLCNGTELHLDHLREGDQYYKHIQGAMDYNAKNVEALMEAIQ